MRWKTAHAKARRAYWQKRKAEFRGATFVEIRPGTWTWPGLLEHSVDATYAGMVVHIPFEREQPNGYRYYPGVGSLCVKKRKKN